MKRKGFGTTAPLLLFSLLFVEVNLRYLAWGQTPPPSTNCRDIDFACCPNCFSSRTCRSQNSEICSGICDNVQLCDQPTPRPTPRPTKRPTNRPSNSPTKGPTPFPTNSPTLHPTKSPSRTPSSSPTSAPSQSPIATPTASPTAAPVYDEDRCSNGVMDGDETDIDCGGSFCDGCRLNQACWFSTDCRSNMCAHFRGGETNGLCALVVPDRVVRGSSEEEERLCFLEDFSETFSLCPGEEEYCVLGVFRGEDFGLEARTIGICFSATNLTFETSFEYENEYEFEYEQLDEDDEKPLTEVEYSASVVLSTLIASAVLIGYAGTGIMVGSVPLGTSAGAGVAGAGSSSSFAEAASTVTILEFLAFAQLSAIGAQMNLPSVPREFKNFSAGFGWLCLTFIPLGDPDRAESDLNQTSTRRLQSGDTEPENDALETYARLLGIESTYLFPSALLGLALVYVVAVNLYVLSVVYLGVRKNKKRRDNHPSGGDRANANDDEAQVFTFSKFWYVCKEAAIRLAYYCVFPLSMVISYQISLLSGFSESRAGETLLFALVAILLLLLAIAWVYFAVRNTYRFPSGALETPAVVDDFDEDENSSRNVAKDQLDDNLRVYRCLVTDWRYESRLFWLARVGVNIVRGCTIGLLQAPRPIQPVFFLFFAVGYCGMLWWYQPYKTRIQNIVALIVSVLYVPNTVLLILFALDSPPFDDRSSRALGRLSIAISVICLIGMGVIVLANYTASISRALNKLPKLGRSGRKNSTGAESSSIPVSLRKQAQLQEDKEEFEFTNVSLADEEGENQTQDQLHIQNVTEKDQVVLTTI